MIRRDTFKLLAGGAGVVALSAIHVPGKAAAVTIYDGRFAASRLFARRAERALDCQADAALLWYSRLARRLGNNASIDGLTTACDAMVFADCARGKGLSMQRLGGVSGGGDLVHWRIAARPLP